MFRVLITSWLIEFHDFIPRPFDEFHDFIPRFFTKFTILLKDRFTKFAFSPPIDWRIFFLFGEIFFTRPYQNSRYFSALDWQKSLFVDEIYNPPNQMMNCDRLTNFRILEGCRLDRLTKLVIFPRSFIEISIFFSKIFGEICVFAPRPMEESYFLLRPIFKIYDFSQRPNLKIFSTIVWRNQFFSTTETQTDFIEFRERKIIAFTFTKVKKIFAEKSHANLRGEKYLTTYFITRNFQILCPIRSIPYAISLSATQRHLPPLQETLETAPLLLRKSISNVNIRWNKIHSWLLI